MSDFNQAIDYVLENEGGLAQDVTGLAKFGLLAPDIEEYRGKMATNDDVKNLSIDEAKLIYKKLYWDKLYLDNLEDTGIATAIFDIGVNQGIYHATKYAQKTCTDLGIVVTEDGMMGHKTLNALGRIGHQIFISNFQKNVIDSYKTLAAINPSKYAKFLNGWINRANRLSVLI